nr:retrovirus-related Pol polyprotein from transposon TNT 1-94 [Tanacetum cinerariifolium]
DEDKEGKAVDPSHYRDADHAGCQDTRRSTSGSVQFLGERLISWSSKRTMATTIEQQVALDEALVPNAQREMLHISPRVLGQSFAELPFEEEILEFLRFLGHSTQIKTLIDVNVNKLYQPWDDVLFSTIKVVSRHQTTQQYSAILPIELTTEDIRNTKAYKEYYACATGEATPKPKASVISVKLYIFKTPKYGLK